LAGEFIVSEQTPDQGTAEAGTSSPVPNAIDVSTKSVAAPPVSETASSEPLIPPKHEPEVSQAGSPANEPKAEPDRIEPKLESPNADSRADPVRSEEQNLDGVRAGAVRAEPSRKRRVGAMAATVVLATFTGALGGAVLTAGFAHIAAMSEASKAAAAANTNAELAAQVARIESDVSALKVGLEHTSKMGMSQFNKTSERLDKLERAQAEPAGKLAKLSETVEKLRTALPAPAPQVTPTPAASREVTGAAPQAVAAADPSSVPASAPASVQTPAAEAGAQPAKSEAAKLPTVEGWFLRDVGYGGALIQGRRGTYEVYAGDVIPGLGRIDAIRRQEGRWVVVTSKGLIVAR
jgi:hypothetical protein